jgi:hypothetical protein
VNNTTFKYSITILLALIILKHYLLSASAFGDSSRTSVRYFEEILKRYPCNKSLSALMVLVSPGIEPGYIVFPSQK